MRSEAQAKLHGGLEYVRQLTNVSRPSISSEGGQKFWIDAVDLSLIIVVRLLDEVIDEHRQILQAISKRREVNGARVQAIEEVRA